MFSETEMLLDLFLQECWKLLGVCSQEESFNSVVQKFNFWSRELEQKSVSSVRHIELPGFREGKCKILQDTHFSHTLCYADYPVCRSYGEGTRNIGERAYCAILILGMSVCIDGNSGFGLGIAVIFGSSKSVLVCSFWPDIGVTHLILFWFCSHVERGTQCYQLSFQKKPKRNAYMDRVSWFLGLLRSHTEMPRDLLLIAWIIENAVIILWYKAKS